MSLLTVATANIFWYGLSAAAATQMNIAFRHTAADDQRLAMLLSRLGADLVAFQEIVDVLRFERLLADVDPALRLRDADGQVLASSPVSDPPGRSQRTLLAWNRQQLNLLHWERLPFGTRAPVAATFEHRASGRRLRVVGVHAKSSAPDSADTAGDKKRQELAALAAWATAETAAGRLQDALILGDFNATAHGLDASHLRQGALAAWRWDEADGDPASRWTTTTDRVVIDHVLVSPSLAAAVASPARIVAFDRDAAVPDDPERAFPGILKCLTDHRPVQLTLDLGP